MYNVGEFVIYGNSGICEIKKITDLRDQGMPKDKLYYLMVPVNEKDSRIYVSVAGVNEGMRKVLSREEASRLIDEVPDIETLDIENDKLREKRYQEVIRSSDCRELISVIKTLYLRKRQRQSAGKKNTSTDEKYFRMAEKNLYSELAFALGEKPERMQEIIADRATAKK